MKRFLWLKSLSRTVHNDQEDGQQDQRLRRGDEYEDDENSNKCTLLTVWRKSLLISCNGFTVIDSNGNLIYRVDNYIGNPQEIILMDASGKSLLAMRRRKRLGLLESWFVYEGEENNDHHHHQYNKRTKSFSSPIFSIRKNINLVISNKKSNIIAQIYRDERCLYVIQGSYANRTCKVLEDWSKKVVAETTMKRDIVKGVSYGVEVFNLIVHPGFDPHFAMALVLLLDQMFS